MNKLAEAGENRWKLPQHAHVVVYDERESELLTIYDCGAAQKPPSAQVIGNLVRIDADHELERSVTGYIVKMRERATLEKQDDDHYVIRS
ncbi:hypothetical protein [Halorussus halophilus]|uniref:hypothetical protein n=1 Tax=Halorussus halophilus TaxID=2650975 RepID=UPI001301898B|nr:hypothetical protein [Halorussus halophilus]